MSPYFLAEAEMKALSIVRLWRKNAANESHVSATFPPPWKRSYRRGMRREKFRSSVDGCDYFFLNFALSTHEERIRDSVMKRGAHVEVTINAGSDAGRKRTIMSRGASSSRPDRGEQISMVLISSVRRQSYVEDCEVCSTASRSVNRKRRRAVSFVAKTLN